MKFEGEKERQEQDGESYQTNGRKMVREIRVVRERLQEPAKPIQS